MCTVTLVPFRAGGQSGIRIACNRDESPGRLTARPPQVRRYGDRSAIMPVDPDSDGTWIAVNDAGLAMVLLNRNPAGACVRPATLRPSRGEIIPGLLRCDDLNSAKRLACKLVSRPFA